MARALLDGQLIAREPSQLRFGLAGPEDDPAIRRLLRENPMDGEIRLTFQREPNYFLGTSIAGVQDQTVVAYERGRVVCVGRCSVAQRYWNGEPRPIAYLSELRLDASVRGRFDILRRGYQFFRSLGTGEPVTFTSIAADNQRSIRFLERGLPGMLAYQHAADYVSLLVPVPGRAGTRSRFRAQGQLKSEGLECVAGSEQWAPEIAACLDRAAKDYQCALVWTPENLHALGQWGLPLTDFLLLVRQREVIACAGLWDQRDFRQVVVSGYGWRSRLARPWVNVAGALFGSPRLPDPGSTVPLAFLSPMAFPQARVELLISLIERALASAADRGIEFLTLGFAAADPRVAAVRSHFASRAYLSRLYMVHWPDQPDPRERRAPSMAPPDARAFCPEVALL